MLPDTCFNSVSPPQKGGNFHEYPNNPNVIWANVTIDGSNKVLFLYPKVGFRLAETIEKIIETLLEISQMEF